MITEMLGREGKTARQEQERLRWPERAFDQELTFGFAQAGRVLLDLLARQDQDAAAAEDTRDELAVDDPFGC
jgi:hypothetical protein